MARPAATSAIVTTGWAALMLGGCSSDSFVAREPELGAAARVAMVLPSAGEARLEALGPVEPFTLDLKDLFAGESPSVSLYVLAYTRPGLVGAFPALGSKSDAELLASLAPTFGPPLPGRYAPPEAAGVLCATLTPDSSDEVVYDQACGERFRQDGAAQFGFALADELACPPGQGPLIIFDRGDTGIACPMSRGAGCDWTPAVACPHLSALTGVNLPGTTRLEQRPPDLLATSDGGLVCRRSAAGLEAGEDLHFQCPNGQFSVQERARRADGSPWALSDGPSLNVQPNGVIASGPTTALYAARSGNAISIRRIFATSTGLDSSPVLSASGSAQSIDATSLGEVRRISATVDGQRILLDAQGGARLLTKGSGALPPEQLPSLYNFPITVPGTFLADRVSQAIVGPSAIYVGIARGIRVLDVDSNNVVMQQAETPAAAGLRFTAGSVISAVREGIADRVVVWEGGQVSVFSEDAQPWLASCAVEGRIVAALDGPSLLRVPTGERFVLEVVPLVQGPPDGCLGPARRIHVPPARPDAQAEELVVEPSGVIETVSGRTLVAYRHGRDVGMLDLESGHSTALALSDERTLTAIFADSRGAELFGVYGARSLTSFTTLRSTLP